MRREDTVVSPLPLRGAPSSFDQAETRVNPPVGRPSTPDPSGRVVQFRQPGPPPPAPGFMAQPSAPPPAPTTRRAAPAPAPAPAPMPERALTSTLNALEDESPAPAAQARGEIIVMFGCRGGAGATTLAVNAGAQLARRGKRVCIVDLDLQLGDVFVALDLEPTTSLSALAREAGTIDGPALRRRLAHHDSGLYALGQTGRLDDVDAELAERMPALLATLIDHFDHVIVDGVRDFGDHALAALDMADRVALVLTQDVAAVRRAARATALFRKLGYSERKVQVILNRHSAKAAVPDAEVERALGLRVSARIRNDYARMSGALNQGALLADVARGAAVTGDLEALAARLSSAGAALDTDRVPKQGLLSRLFSRRGK